jgi:hypothetical protein
MALKPGQVFNDTRTDSETVLVYENSDVVLIRNRGAHHLVGRQQFKRALGTRYKLIRVDESEKPIVIQRLRDLIEKYQSKEGRKSDHKVSALNELIQLVEQGNTEKENTEQSEGEPPQHKNTDKFSVKDAPRIGDKTAQSLQENGYTTPRSILNEKRENLVSLEYLGEQKVSSLIDLAEEHLSGMEVDNNG